MVCSMAKASGLRDDVILITVMAKEHMLKIKNIILYVMLNFKPPVHACVKLAYLKCEGGISHSEPTPCFRCAKQPFKLPCSCIFL